MLRRHSGKVVLIGFLLVIVFVYIIPINVAYKISSIGKVYPEKKWSFKKVNDQYLTELNNFQTGLITPLQNYSFDRGDIVDLQMLSDFSTNKYVSRDTPILRFTSFLLHQEINRCNRELDEEIANLNVEMTGSKLSLVKEAEEQVELARQTLSLKEKAYERGNLLFIDSIIAAAEYEVIENQFTLAKTQLALANQQLNSATTGEKNENLKLIKTRINGIERELDLLEKKKDNYVVYAPFDAEVTQYPDPEEMFSLIDTNGQVVLVPIDVADKKYLNVQVVKACVQVESGEENFKYDVNLDSQVNVISNRQVMFARVTIPKEDKRLDDGLMINCTILCDTISLREYVKRKLFL